jgi:hypothetical protein
MFWPGAKSRLSAFQNSVKARQASLSAERRVLNWQTPVALAWRSGSPTGKEVRPAAIPMGAMLIELRSSGVYAIQ